MPRNRISHEKYGNFPGFSEMGGGGGGAEGQQKRAGDERELEEEEGHDVGGETDMGPGQGLGGPGRTACDIPPPRHAPTTAC